MITNEVSTHTSNEYVKNCYGHTSRHSLSQSIYWWSEKVIINKFLFLQRNLNIILYEATVCCLKCFKFFKIMNKKLPKRMNLFSIEVFRKLKLKCSKVKKIKNIKNNMLPETHYSLIYQNNLVLNLPKDLILKLKAHLAYNRRTRMLFLQDWTMKHLSVVVK